MNDRVKLILVALGIVLFPTIIAVGSDMLSLDIDFTIYLILSLFLLIPFVFVVLLLKNQNRELRKLNNNEKIGFTINPFSDIKNLIRLAKPGEIIKDTKKSFEMISANYWIHPMLFMNILPNLFFPIKIIETNNAYYFDRRISNILGTFLILILVLLLNVFIQTYIQLIPSFLVVIAFILIARLIYVFVFPLNQILLIKKDWITEKNENSKWFSVRGAYPKNAIRTLNPDPFFSSWGGLTNSFFHKFRN